MSGEQAINTLLIIVAIAAIAYCLKGIGFVAVKEIFKTKRISLA